MSKKYIALQAIQLGSKDERISIEPASQDGKSSGLFEHDFDRKTEKRLLDIGAIRRAEGVEVHEEPAPQEILHDSRDIQGQVVSATTDPLDHDGDGKKGGSKPKAAKAIKADDANAEPGAAEGDPLADA